MPSHRASRVRSLLTLGLAVAALGAHAADARAQSEPIVVFLVRHAERAEDGTNDPPISVEGQERAERLVGIFRDARITHIHTTDFKRTRETVAPVARALGIEVMPYDPRDLAAFAARLRETPGRHLVVGHSNTTPELVEALGGDPAGPIEEMEYDRAYVVVVLPRGGTGSAVFRYGRPYDRR